MHVKLFILGLPGSGKSAVARYILNYVSHYQVNEQNDLSWWTIRFNDYAILLHMFHEDTEGKSFQPTGLGGFDLLDLNIFDEALQRLEQEVNIYINSLKPEEKKLALIEFSRNDYQKAFHQFRPEFLQNAYFLYLDVDIEACKRRVRERIAYPSTEDDFNVSEYIFEEYYSGDDGRYLPQILEKDYGIDKHRVMVVDNNGSLEDAAVAIYQFVDTIIANEAQFKLETEPMPKITDLMPNGELEHQ